MLKWVLGILGALVVLGGVGVGAYMLGKTAASDPGAASSEASPNEDGDAVASGAEAVADDTGDTGVPGSETPDDKAEPPRQVNETPRPENWPVFSIELAVFRNLENAREFISTLPDINLPVEIVETMDISGKSWYRIRMGKFDDPRQAGARLSDIEKTAGLLGIVVTEVRTENGAVSQ